MKLLITGANRGLGLAITKAAIDRGHVVAAAARSGSEGMEKLAQLSECYPEQVHIVTLDVTDEASIGRAAIEVQEKVQSLDTIVNNAGYLSERYVPIEDITMEETIRTFDINLFGPVRIVKYFLPLLRKGDVRSVLNITSEAGSITNAIGGNYAYSISKTALNMFSEQLSCYLKPDGIPVYAVHPGWMQTDMGGPNARLAPAQTAEGIVALAEGKWVNTRYVFIDYNGVPMVI